MYVIPGLGKQRLEDCFEFKASLGYDCAILFPK